MASLFIIGNGFDLAHELRTSYEDFRLYLLSQYPDASADEFIVPEGSLMPDGGIGYDDDEVVGFLLSFLSSAESKGDRWSDLENTLGTLDYGWCFDDLPEMLDRDGDRNMWHEVHNNEDRAEDLVIPMLRIADLFSDWINTIDISTVKPRSRFVRLIDMEQDHFLSFNYTETLEKVYGVERVSHIHGKQGEKLVFGHGNDTDYYESYMSRHTGAESALQRIQESLKKNTAKAIRDHRSFFRKLAASPIDRIYSYGFSYSEVDRVYIGEICSCMSTGPITWYLHRRDREPSGFVDRRRQYEMVIRSLGFSGKFAVYRA
ncbi:MAG: bacteriophage abortive infection AbiH family protein [Peptococcaceae bacterium]|nr:bacteriophage abortive infection AbiH family protein [Peptococcaceae bacterium]